MVSKISTAALPAMVLIPAETILGEFEALKDRLEQISIQLNSKKETDEQWMTIKEACEYMNISEPSFHRKKNEPDFPFELCWDNDRTKRYRLRNTKQ